ncbi:YkvA family protein [Desulfitobacterium sp. AusDCA]|uniref:YkvA family protein n=1 Tax=Desulfitobacterium sp. AusDCA TaxID=3240383 RepID=UPI003DA77234
MLKKIKAKAKELKKQTLTLYLAYTHKRVRAYKKAFLLLIMIYALSPIDLIPDFIPVLGMLDDLIIIPLGIMIAIKIIPHEIWEECREEAEKGVSIDPKYKKIGAGFIICIWVIALILMLKGLIYYKS